MKDLYAGFAAAKWPKPADPGLVEVRLEQWREAAESLADRGARAFLRRLGEAATGRALLAAIFGSSPYLSTSLIDDPEFAALLLRRGPDAASAGVLDGWRAELGGEIDEAGLMSGLRRGKRRFALAVALADIGGVWPLERITGALSECAETTLDLAARHLVRVAMRAGVLRVRDAKAPERSSGLIVLGMGKLGARELNYSSDIDLIVLYDPDRIDCDDREALQPAFVKLTRGLVRIIEERSTDGYVFRTDLRLRPDPGSTPVAMSALAAETYYESLGQNWERAAMIKARPVAGDRDAGAAFLANLRPYIWRKNLDFAAIQDIHSIKRQINAQRHGGAEALPGRNIKLDPGGIREIEFFAQTQQLVWGGRIPELRISPTCEAIAALAAARRVEPVVATEMILAYRVLRHVEHRLQMIDDRQTHTLPDDEERLTALAVFLGYPGLKAFTTALTRQLRLVEKHYGELFEEAPSLSGPGNLVFTGAEDDPATLETLRKLGFAEPSTVASAVRGWHHGRFRAMRSTRARELLTELMPALLQALAKTSQPDMAFARFDQFLAQLPAGVQLFSLFQANPALLELVADIMGDAPRLSELLSRRPHLLDGVLADDFLEPPPAGAALAATLDAALREARDYQDVLDLVRRWKNEREFQVGVQMLRGVLDAETAGGALAAIADTALAALQPHAAADFARVHGRVAGGDFSIVAYGKLGGRELTVTSDLDVIFLWDAVDGAESRGTDKPLPASVYYQRFGQRLINAVTAPTGEGALYELDLRLRPSGAKGPLAVNLAGFVTYQREEAWTWEHMALTRARALTGAPAFRARIEAAIGAALTRPRDPAKLARDIAEMRARMAQEHHPERPWEIKHWRGGLIDVEFIAQYLQLRHAARHRDILSVNTADALRRAVKSGVLPARAGNTLLAALTLWRAVQGLLRLTIEGEFDPGAAPAGLKQALARAAGAVDFVALEAMMLVRSAETLKLFDILIKGGVDHGGEEKGEKEGQEESGAQGGRAASRSQARQKAGQKGRQKSGQKNRKKSVKKARGKKG